MAVDCSRDSFLTYLREAAVTGRMHPATARSRRKAAEALFEQLTDSEAADLRELDIAALTQRFRDSRHSTLRGEVVELYARRLDRALEDYLSYSGVSAPVATATAAPSVAPSSAEAGTHSIETQALESVRLSFDREQTDVIPIPLERGRVVYLHGLPPDLTAAEAGKIARVVQAFSSDGDDES